MGEALSSAAAAGLLGACTLLLPTLGTALLYEHGRYLPLWLPALGVGGAYLLHALWSAGISPAASLLLTLICCIVVAIAIHALLLARFLELEDYLSPLLIGIGLGEVLAGLTSVYGEGMSQHYPGALGESIYLAPVGMAVYWVDLISAALASVYLGALWAFLTRTRTGLEVRAVMANRDFAQSLNLRVAYVDAAVVALAAVAMVIGVVSRGARIDLQPSMMFFPGLTAIVACVVVGPGHRALALLATIGMEVVVRIVGVLPAVSPMQRAVPFMLLVVVLAVRVRRMSPTLAVSRP